MKKKFVFVIIVLISAGSAEGASPRTLVRRGNELFQQEEYDKALGMYEKALKEDPESPVVNFDIGTVLYKNEEYAAAGRHFNAALLSEDERIRQNAHYNLGNTHYHLGLEKEDEAPTQAMHHFENALTHYERALAEDPSDEDAQYNREIVKKELERLKEKLEKQKQQDTRQEEQKKEQPEEEKEKQREEQEMSSQPQEKNTEKKTEGKQDKESTKEDGKPLDRQNLRWDGNTEGRPAGGEDDEEGDGEREGMSKREARTLLESYQQSEEPERLLNFELLKQKRSFEDVEKDW